MKPKLFLLIILIQIIIVSVLGIKIYNQQKKVLGTSINPIPKNSLLFPKNDSYKYFYEPKPNNIETSDSDIFSEKYTITINNDSLNANKKFSIAKEKNTFRIITIGDSFTWGGRVGTSDNYPSQLENLLNSKLNCKNIKNFEVLNLGVGAYDIPYTVERYRLRGQKYTPDLVLWFIINDDFKRNNEQLIPSATDLENKLKATDEYNKLVKEGDYYYAWEKIKEDLVSEAGGEGKMLKWQEANMGKLDKFYKGPLVVFTFPYPLTDKASLTTLKHYSKERSNTLFFNDLPNIEQQHLTLVDGHPSPKGYTAIANTLYDYLTKNNIIPCEKL